MVSVAEEYLAYGIRNHPSVSASYICFLVHHTNSAAVADLEKQVKTLQTSLSALQKEIGEVQKIANSAESKASAAKASAAKREEVAMVEVEVEVEWEASCHDKWSIRSRSVRSAPSSVCATFTAAFRSLRIRGSARHGCTRR